MSEKKPLDEAKTSRVLADVLEERRRQHEKWGEQNLPDDSPATTGLVYRSAQSVRDAIVNAIWWDQRPPEERESVWASSAPLLAWPLVLFEEVVEALDEAALTGTFDEPCGDPNQAALRLRAELVQVAAVAVQWIEAIDRRTQQQMDEAHERSIAALPPHKQAFARVYEEAHRNQAALERHLGPPPRVQVCPPPGQIVAMDFSKFERSVEPMKVGPLEVVALESTPLGVFAVASGGEVVFGHLDTGPESFTARQEVPVEPGRFVPEKDDREIIALPEGGSAEAFKRSREESRRDIRCERPTTLDGFDDIEYSVGGLTDPEGGEP